VTRRGLVLATAALATVAAVWLVARGRGRGDDGGATTRSSVASGEVTGPARAPRLAPPRPAGTAGLHGPLSPPPAVDPSAGVGDPAPPEVSDALVAALARVTERARTCFTDGAPAGSLAYTITFAVRDQQGRVTELVFDDQPDGSPLRDCVKGAVVGGGTVPLALPDATIPVSSEWQPADLVAVR